MSLTLKTGDLAYFDSSRGLIPCKVVCIVAADHGANHAKVRYTATRGAFERGEFGTWSATRIVPRKAVYRRRGEYFPRILPYTVEVDQ